MWCTKAVDEFLGLDFVINRRLRSRLSQDLSRAWRSIVPQRQTDNGHGRVPLIIDEIDLI